MIGTAEEDLELDDFEGDLSRVPPDICPSCGESFENTPSHWRQSDHCSEPVLQEHQREVLKGLLAVGGGIRRNGKFPHFEMASTNRRLLEWIHRQFGAVAGDVREARREQVITQIDRLKQDRTVEDFSTLYILTTKSLKQLDSWISAWYDGDRNRWFPVQIEASPTMLRTAYAVAGGINRNGRAYIGMTATEPSQQVLDRILEKFAPRRVNVGSGNTSIRVVLYNSTAFFDYIGGPVPVARERWPAEPLDEPERVCPTCNGRFDSLAGHWVKVESHGPPPIGEDLQEVIDGALLAGARLGGEDTKNARLLLATTARPYLEWVADQLDWLARDIHTIATPEEGHRYPSERSGEDTTNARAVHELRTTAHPHFTEIRSRLDEEPRAVYGDIERTPLTLALMFGRHGRMVSTEYAPYIRVNCGRVPAPDDVLLDLFDPWDPNLVNNDRRLIHLRGDDVQSFLDYIGDLPPGLEDRWKAEEPATR